MTLSLLGNTLLQTAITRNLVSFPAQVQPFMRRTSGDLQERIVQLYFVRGWSVRRICERYHLTKAMAHKLIAAWRIRAVEAGYIQEITPGTIDAPIGEADSIESNVDIGVFEPPPLVFEPLQTFQLEALTQLAEIDYSIEVPLQVSPATNPATLSAGSGM